MRVMRQLRGLLASLLVLAGCFLFHVESALGQTAPTAEELQIFQGLSPEQQQAIMEQLGKGATDQSSGLGTPGGAQSPDQFGRPRTISPLARPIRPRAAVGNARKMKKIRKRKNR